MRRRLVLRAMAALLALAAGCTGGAAHPAPPTSGGSPRRPPPASPGHATLPEVVLTARLSDRPARWRPVVFLPFGRSERDLGYRTFPDGPASQPSSFAITPDGTIWIADRWKERVAHYAPDGRYLGSAAVDVGRGRIKDMVAVGSALYVSTRYQFGRLWRIDPPGGVVPIVVHDDLGSIVVEEVAATRLGLVGLINGHTEALLGGREDGPKGYAAIGDDGTFRMLPGLPVGSDSYFSLTSSDHRHFVATYRRPGSVQEQPIRIDLLRRGASKPARTLAGPGTPTPIGEDILSLVEVSAAMPKSPEDGGRWLLRIGRSPILWEPVARPHIDDEPPQWRHLTPGPGGAIYLMLAERGGVEILRRDP